MNKVQIKATIDGEERTSLVPESSLSMWMAAGWQVVGDESDADPDASGSVDPNAPPPGQTEPAPARQPAAKPAPTVTKEG